MRRTRTAGAPGARARGAAPPGWGFLAHLRFLVYLVSFIPQSWLALFSLRRPPRPGKPGGPSMK